ncbi:MAG: hypothetical protein HPY55_12640 [Firmicutes bacterium]|nr:hypothetical protein [Bacillota bacterium]
MRTVALALDNDDPGRNNSAKFELNLTNLGYGVIDMSPPKEYKDWNDALTGKMWRR